MRAPHTLWLSAVSVGVAALLLACGGGSSSTIATPTTLSGVAATGAAFEGGVITVTDRTGSVVGTSSAVGSDGRFSITLTATAQAPFVLSASRTNADGQTETLVSVVPTASSTATTVNISPVTQLIAARLSVSGDPSKLAAEVAAGTSAVSTSTVAAKVLEVQTMLAPLLTATGNTGADPLTATFATDGTGYDRLLDSLQVTIVPASASTSNIEVGVKQQQADGAAPTVLSFTSADTNLTALPAISSTNLVPSGTATQIATLLAQLNTCFALPTATRVNTAVSNGVATGSASNVVAAACTAAFHGNTPGSFLDNGGTVGRDSNGNGAFSGLFKDGATGVVFSQGQYEFTRNNGDIVAGYKTRDSGGNEAYDTFVVRKDLADGKLKLIGNQYAYPGGVVAYQQLREFVTQPAANYYSTGYDLRVPLIAGVGYVDVLTPRGNHLTLIPGSDAMVLPKRGVSPLAASGTTYLRIRSEYVTPNAALSHPSVRDGGLFFVATDFSELDVTNIPSQGVWTFSYYAGYTVDQAGTVTGTGSPVTQHYKTRNRANSIAELKTQSWAALSAASLSNMVGRVVPNNSSGYATLPSSGNMAVSWTVSTGALPPTNIKLFGKGLDYNYATTPAVALTTRSNFNDGKSVKADARSGTIACADGAVNNNVGEKHCASPDGYLSTAFQLGLHLLARDVSGREYVRFYAPYTLQ